MTSGRAGSFAYVYDRYGNRWQQNVTSGSGPSPQLSFDKTTNRINSGSYAYDAAGNMSSDGFHTYTYDADGNVTAVDGGTTAQYVYNALNQRVEVTTASGSYEYLYDAEGHQISKWLSSNSGYGARIYWGNQVLASRTTNGYTYFEGKDWTGTERIRTDASGAAVATYTSLPFGDGNTVSGSNPDAQQDVPKYAMLDLDNESGTDHATFRQYSDTQGRWMSPDPYYGSYNVNDPQSMNRFSYVMNNPLVYVDPDGTSMTQCGDSYCVTPDPGPPPPQPTNPVSCAGAQACVRTTPPSSPPTTNPPPPSNPCDGPDGCSAGGSSGSGPSGPGSNGQQGSGPGAGSGQGGTPNNGQQQQPQPQNPQQQQPGPSRFSRNTCFYLDWGSGYLGALSLATFVQPEAAVVTVPLGIASSGAWIVGKIGGC